MKRSALIVTMFVACGSEKEMHVVYRANETTKQPSHEIIQTYDSVMSENIDNNTFSQYMTKEYTTFDIPGTHYQCYIPAKWQGIYRKGEITLVLNETEHELVIVLDVQTINSSPQELLLAMFTDKNIVVTPCYDTQAMEGIIFEGDGECVGIKIVILQFRDWVTVTCSMVIPSFFTKEESLLLNQAYETVVTTLRKKEVYQ